MQNMVMIESAVRGLLYVNGQFCGPVDGAGQAFPAGGHAEIFVQLFPFGEGAPLAAEMILRAGRIVHLSPAESCFALQWPDGVIELELRPQAGSPSPEGAEDGERREAQGMLLHYLNLRLAGEERAASMLMHPQAACPDLSGYHAAVPLRFAPLAAEGMYDERAGLVTRLGENVARVDAALAASAPAGAGRRVIERIDVVRS